MVDARFFSPDKVCGRCGRHIYGFYIYHNDRYYCVMCWTHMKSIEKYSDLLMEADPDEFEDKGEV